MRLGRESDDTFLQELGKITDAISDKYLDKIKPHIDIAKIKVMLGDGTVTEQDTFDPKRIQAYYQRLTGDLKDWTVRETVSSSDKDLRRMFTKFEIQIGNYVLSGHVSTQFHVLLYYKPDNRVIQCQKELSDLLDETQDQHTQLAQLGDQLVLDSLREKGHSKLDHQSLFELFYENEDLVEEIQHDIDGRSDTNFKTLDKKKSALLAELDGLLVETYQVSPTLLDDQRLTTGEEGSLCTFDLEYIRNNVKEGLFDPKRIPQDIKDSIIERLNEFAARL